MGDDVRAKLIYDVSDAKVKVKSLGDDLSKLEKPIRLSLVVEGTQLEGAVANVGVLQDALGQLQGAVTIDDAVLTEAVDQATVLDEDLQNLDGTVTISDEDLALAADEATQLSDDLQGLDGTVTLDDGDVAAAVSDVEDLGAAIDDISGSQVDVGGIATVGDAAGVASGEVENLNETLQHTEQEASNMGATAGAVAGNIGQLGAAGAVAGGELESVGGITSLLGEGLSSLTEKAEGLATSFGADLGPEAEALLGTLAGLGAGAAVFGTVIDKIVQSSVEGQSAEARLEIATKGNAEGFQELADAGLGVLDTQHKVAQALGSTAASVDQVNAKQALLIGQNQILTDEQKKQLETNLSLIAANATTIGLQHDYATALDGTIKGLANYQRAGLAYGVALSQQQIEQEQAKLGIEGTFASLDKTTKAFIVSSAAVENYGDNMRTNVAEANKIADLSFAGVQTQFENFLDTMGRPLIAPALDLLKAAEPIGADLAQAFGDVATVVLPVITKVLDAGEPLIKLFTDELGPAIDAISPAVAEMGDALAAALKDPETVHAVKDLAKATADFLVAAAPLLPLLIEMEPIMPVIAIGAEQLAVSLQIATLQLQPFVEVMKGLGLISDNPPPMEVFVPPIEGAGNAAGDAKPKIDDLDLSLDQLIEKLSQDPASDFSLDRQVRETERLRTAMVDATVSVNDLGKAIKDQFSAPTTFDLAIAQANFEKAKADALLAVRKLSGEAPAERTADSLAILEKLRSEFEKTVEAQAALGQFDPGKFDQERQHLIDFANGLGLPTDQVNAFVDSLNGIGPGRDIEIRLAIKQSVDDLGKLKSTQEILATLLANPEIVQNLKVFGVPESLANADQVQEAMDLLDGTEANPEIIADAEQFLRTADLTQYRMQILDALNAEPTVTLDDQATAAIQNVAAQLAQIAVEHVATVDVSGNAQAQLLGIQLAALAAEAAIQRLKIQAVVNAAVSVVTGHAEGVVSDVEHLAWISEGNKRELVLPLEQPWGHQMDLLAQAGVLQRLEEQFSAQEQARAQTLNAALGWHGGSAQAGASTATTSGPDLEQLAIRMEQAAIKAAEAARPVQVIVPAVHDPHEQARIVARKLTRV